MYRTILVPLDESAFAEAALSPALEVARRSGAGVHLVSVAREDGEPGSDAVREVERKKDYLQRTVRRIEAAERIEPAGRPETGGVRWRVERGEVTEALVRTVGELTPDLVVMTTHGRGAVERFWMGGVADAVIREGGVPVLLIRPGGEPARRFRLREILVPQEPSSTSRAILPHAMKLGSLMGSRFTILRVLPATVPFDAGYFPEVMEAQLPDEEEVGAARRHLQELSSLFLERGLEVRAEVVGGAQPVEGILSHLEGHPVDLVALSTRGHVGLRRILLGSVMERLVRTYGGPFLLVRGE